MKRDFRLFGLAYIAMAVLFSASGTGVALFIVFLTPFALRNLKSTAIACLLLILALMLLNIPDRLKEIINIFNKMDNQTLTEIFYVSGFRFPSVVASYVYSFNQIWPGGAGSWFVRITDAYEVIGVDIRELGHFVDTGVWAPTKPTSLFATISLEFGLAGLLFSLAFFIYLISRFNRLDEKFSPYFAVALFGSFALSTVGNPSYPLILALAISGKLKKSI